MSDAQTIYALIGATTAVANVGLLTAIFFRLGKVTEQLSQQDEDIRTLKKLWSPYLPIDAH